MITVYPYASLGKSDFGWLQARHHFSFGHYINPERVVFGSLRVINDDIISSGQGFPTHSHKEMEIITYVRSGAITHQDSEGNSGKIKAGEIQVMSAGTGVAHSEYNYEYTPTSIYQIWIQPKVNRMKPRWESQAINFEQNINQLVAVASGRDPDISSGAIEIYQDATVFAGFLKPYVEIVQSIKYFSLVRVCHS
jgi:quercetin 2,3-dioxygenase